VTPLHAAAEKNHISLVQTLLDAGAEIEAITTWGMTPLEWAANMGSGAAAAVLLTRGARLNLWSAAALGMVDAVNGFIEATGKLKTGAAQNRYSQQLNGDWETLPPPTDFTEAISDAFYIACRNGRTEVARLLRGYGADTNFRGFFGGTGLHWASINGHADTVEYLLEAGADTALRDTEFEATPAEWAAEGGQDAIVVLFADGGSDAG
jgi:ankyrin repeat protein